VTDIVKALIADRDIGTVVTGIRPGEKVHEILVSEEEAFRTIARGNYYVILPMLPELRSSEVIDNALGHEFSSADNLMSDVELAELLAKHKLLVQDRLVYEEDMLA
jgi:UDP-glucose 4-epimerase